MESLEGINNILTTKIERERKTRRYGIERASVTEGGTMIAGFVIEVTVPSPT